MIITRPTAVATRPTLAAWIHQHVTYQMPTLTANATSGGYDARLTVGIAA